MRIAFILVCLMCLTDVYGQSISANKSEIEHISQAIPPPTQAIDAAAFDTINYTSIHWLGNAGFFINSRGTDIMVDPVLKGFDIPLLIDMPIQPEEVPRLDAVLVTHCDNDHFSTITCSEMKKICKAYHSTHYVASLMKDIGLQSYGHEIGDSFYIGAIKATLLYADHAWQNYFGHIRKFEDNDFCGFWLETPDGTIWAPGDSRFHQNMLEMQAKPDVIFFDFSDDPWHIGLDNAIKVANTYPNARLLLSHWGTVDASDMKPFNANPKDLEGKIVNPERVHLLAPGEKFILSKQETTMDKHKVRLSKITVDPAMLSEYNAYLKEEVEASMRLEPGVLTLYAVAEKERPNRITILEIYASEEAYQSHINRKQPVFSACLMRRQTVSLNRPGIKFCF